MSTANHDSSRGRNAGRGRPSRGKGRGRGTFRFPASKTTATSREHGPGDISTMGSRANPRGDDTRTRQSEKMAGNPETVADSIPSMNANEDSPSSKLSKRELPPHIAGAAVDGESLASRVRDLAISSHAHTGSIESRFTMSLNWADEEDDPDSLPDLDDWAIGPKVSVASQNTFDPEPSFAPSDPREVDATLRDPVVDLATTPLTKEPLPGGDKSAEHVENNPRMSPHRPSRSGGGSAASIWAPKQQLPPPGSTHRGRGRQHTSRDSRDATRTRNTPPPQAASLTQTIATPSEGERKSTRYGTGAKKPHARPVISTDALARISRTLGAEVVRKEQPTAT
ncbi:hypothetical protein PIIN_00845 [Serendipita indica DSM 11827]|uniref:Uncharacterized protein n=1 Tax=Serendipita indica (strain DSM 11827) TaxID=1109443 RepID=G4T6Q2_SERID|nr:hypothetical protein PIIN_00845 [Serendipita indica DSM 11827]